MVHTKKSKKIPYFIASLIIIAGLGFSGYKLLHKNQQQAISKPGTINLSPPTAADTAANDAHKQAVVEQQKAASQQSTNSAAAASVSPIISFADSTEVDAFIPNITENDGSCTLTLTKGSATITKKGDAIADATTTRCHNFALTATDFSSKGSWQAVVSYSSSRSSGASAPVNIEVK